MTAPEPVSPFYRPPMPRLGRGLVWSALRQEIDDEEVNRQFGGSEAGGDAPGPEEAA